MWGRFPRGHGLSQFRNATLMCRIVTSTHTQWMHPYTWKLLLILEFIVRRRRNVDGHYLYQTSIVPRRDWIGQLQYVHGAYISMASHIYEHLQVLRTLGVLLIITCGFLYIQSEGGHTGSLQPVAHWYVSPVVQTFNCVWDFRSLK